MKLAEKAYAYFLSDKNTPILGWFVSKVVSFYDPSTFANLHDVWNAGLDAELHYPNQEINGWMLTYAEQALSGFDFKRFQGWLDGKHTLTTLLSPPLCIEPKAAISAVPVVVDGDVVGGPVRKNRTRAKDHPKAWTGKPRTDTRSPAEPTKTKADQTGVSSQVSRDPTPGAKAGPSGAPPPAPPRAAQRAHDKPRAPAGAGVAERGPKPSGIDKPRAPEGAGVGGRSRQPSGRGKGEARKGKPP
jgi:hypothetical protein